MQLLWAGVLALITVAAADANNGTGTALLQARSNVTKLDFKRKLIQRRNKKRISQQLGLESEYEVSVPGVVTVKVDSSGVSGSASIPGIFQVKGEIGENGIGTSGGSSLAGTSFGGNIGPGGVEGNMNTPIGGVDAKVGSNGVDYKAKTLAGSVEACKSGACQRADPRAAPPRARATRRVRSATR